MYVFVLHIPYRSGQSLGAYLLGIVIAKYYDLALSSVLYPEFGNSHSYILSLGRFWFLVLGVVIAKYYDLALSVALYPEFGNSHS